MPTKLDIELTARQNDAVWSWRAAGAKLPKGSLDAKVLYEGAKIGDVVKAETEVGIDGIEILAVSPPFKRTEKEIERIRIEGSRKSAEGGVTTALVGKKRGDKRGRDRDDKGGGERPRRPRDGEARGSRPGARQTRGRDGDRTSRDRDRSPREERARAPRIMPTMKHRGAILDTLEPQQRRLAEQLLKGGMAAVRRALEEDVRVAADSGQTTIDLTPLLTAAEDLWPTLKTADWMDKAEATMAIANEVSLRDLRAIVTTGDANSRTDESRELVTKLRETLDKRVEESKTNWLTEIETCTTDGRIIRALRVSSRPPDPSVKFPAELATKLTEAANEALAPDIEVDRWLAVLDAVTVSPVRRNVVPRGLPVDKNDPRLDPAKSAAAKVPSLAKLFDLSIPPPPTGRIAPPPPKRTGAPRPKAKPAESVVKEETEASSEISDAVEEAPES